jgi:hypothetical protein
MKTKHVSFALFILVLLGCSSKQSSTFKIITHNAPDDGVVTLTRMNDTSVKVITDAIGMRYFELESKSNKTLIRAKYQVATPEGTMDGGRTEELIFYWPNLDNNQTYWEDDAFTTLQPMLMRACFCRGEVGLFDISKGKLVLDTKKRTFEVHFQVESGSQFFSSFTATY